MQRYTNKVNAFNGIKFEHKFCGGRPNWYNGSPNQIEIWVNFNNNNICMSTQWDKGKFQQQQQLYVHSMGQGKFQQQQQFYVHSMGQR